MQDAFPWVDNYWDSSECGLHCTREHVCTWTRVSWKCLPLSSLFLPNMGPQAPWVPILPATRDEDGNGVSPPPFSVILVIEGSIG